MLTKVLLLALALLPRQSPTLKVADYVSQSDPGCSEASAGPCDLSPALERVMSQASLVPAPPGMFPLGSLIELPCGEFKLSSPIRSERGHTIRGCGGGGRSSPTVLRVTTSTHGVLVRPSGANTVLEGFRLMLDGPALTADRHAIKLEGRADIRNVSIKGGVHGIHIWAAAKLLGTNVNNGVISGVFIEQTEHAAIYINGPDANQLAFINPETVYACQKASKWNADFEGKCAAILDSSFLGVQFFAAHTETTRDEMTVPYTLYPGYIFDSTGSQRSTCTGCYSEGNQLPGVISAQSNVFGGIGAWTGPGMRIEGTLVSSLRALGTPLTPGAVAPTLVLGALATLPGSVLMALPPQVANPQVPVNAALRLRLSADLNKKGWKWDMAGAGVGVSQRVLAEPGKYGVTSIKTSTASNL